MRDVLAHLPATEGYHRACLGSASRAPAALTRRLDTGVGAYPCRRQAFHLASELAIHADDVGVPVDRRRPRVGWRGASGSPGRDRRGPAGRGTTVSGGRTTVRGGVTSAEVDDGHLVEGAAARLDDSSGLTERQRARLLGIPVQP